MLTAAVLVCWMLSPAIAAEPVKPAATLFATEPDGTVHIPSMDLPFSSLASEEARQAFVKGIARVLRLGEWLGGGRFQLSGDLLRPEGRA